MGLDTHLPTRFRQCVCPLYTYSYAINDSNEVGNVPIDVENGESVLPLVTLRGLHLLSKCGVV